ncbi:uncharacterized protein OCT59_009791 [Rhizophagus irregularis]|uniref:uncharacterized protein n=1 Tax=Rhizophagus irregularis TaxID=588596 RepID=UPI00331DAAB7|nr:hypothetical protein OCT59_009791 [Rhizophagus irregularis]
MILFGCRITYDKFNNIEEIGEGYFVKYLAIWNEGPLYYDYNKYEYLRLQNKEVALLETRNITDESLKNDQNLTRIITGYVHVM